MSSHHLAVVEAPHRDQLRRMLAAEGIGTGIHYAIPAPPACLQHLCDASFVGGRARGRRLLSLPMHPHLAESDIGRVASALARALDQLEPAALPGLAA